MNTYPLHQNLGNFPRWNPVQKNPAFYDGIYGPTIGLTFVNDITRLSLHPTNVVQDHIDTVDRRSTGVDHFTNDVKAINDVKRLIKPNKSKKSFQNLA